MSVVKFDKSPLTEVVFGVKFDASDFSSVDFGMYWQTIKEEFPYQPLDRPPIGEIELFPILPSLHRVWFQSFDQKQLIQLQSNRFHYNWRSQASKNEYPHFEKIYPIFEKKWLDFQEWWLEKKDTTFPLRPIHYELTYVNEIDINFGWSDSGDTNNFFTFINKNWSETFQKPKSINAELEFDIPDEMGVLSIRINQIIKLESNTPALILDLTTKSNNTEIEIKKWFELAHDFTVKAFLDLLQNQIKNEWGLKWIQK